MVMYLMWNVFEIELSCVLSIGFHRYAHTLDYPDDQLLFRPTTIFKILRFSQETGETIGIHRGDKTSTYHADKI